MKNRQLLLSLLALSIIFNPLNVLQAKAHVHHPKFIEGHKHTDLNEQEWNNLMQKGYSRQEIFKAHIIAKHSNEKDLEKILMVYKKNKSWKETAKQFGVNLEQLKRDHIKKHKEFFDKHKQQIIQYLSSYTGKSYTELNNYLKEDVDLHFLVVAAAISKKSNKDISQIIQYKKEGKDFKEILSTLKLDPTVIIEEAKVIHKGIRDAIEKE
ncbi:hypothetical protein J6TS2_51300 [Heyndrickxia sporothermodurans]|nr:hypothetical protein J6TS2_51300 [Heyndrickxia sporothermodurans]